MKRTSYLLTTGVVIALCTACSSGGGGDSGTGPGQIPPVAGPLSITTANAPQVSGAVVNATTGLQDVSGIVGAGTLGTSAKQQKAGGVAAFAQSKTDINETVQCTGGGSLRITGQLNDATTLSVGDSISSSFASCAEFGGVINGAFDFVIDRIVGSPNDILAGRFALGASVITNDFSITSGGDTTTANGDFQFDIDTTSSAISLLELSGNVFSVDNAGDTLTLSNFTIERTEDTGSSAYTLKTSGTVDSAELQGSVSYVTVQTFVGIGEDFPYAGELRITGGDGSTMNLIAISSASVRLEIDSDGDGAIDNTVDTTWADITG